MQSGVFPQARGRKPRQWINTIVNLYSIHFMKNIEIGTIVRDTTNKYDKCPHKYRWWKFLELAAERVAWSLKVSVFTPAACNGSLLTQHCEASSNWERESSEDCWRPRPEHEHLNFVLKMTALQWLTQEWYSLSVDIGQKILILAVPQSWYPRKFFSKLFFSDLQWGES